MSDQINLDLENEGIFVSCACCGSGLLPLQDITTLIRLKQKCQRYGKHIFLIRGEFESKSLEVYSEEQYLQNEQNPFFLMYMHPVKCNTCKNHLGFKFETVNKSHDDMLGRIAIKQDSIEIKDGTTNIKFNLIEYTLTQFDKEQQQNKKTKERRRKSAEQEWTNKIETQKQQYKINEKELAETLMQTVKGSQSQKLIKQILESFQYYNNILNNFQRRASDLYAITLHLNKKIQSKLPEVRKRNQ